MEYQHCLEKFPTWQSEISSLPTLTTLLIQVEFFLPTSYVPPGKKKTKTKQNLKAIENLKVKALDEEEILERPVQVEVQRHPVP